MRVKIIAIVPHPRQGSLQQIMAREQGSLQQIVDNPINTAFAMAKTPFYPYVVEYSCEFAMEQDLPIAMLGYTRFLFSNGMTFYGPLRSDAEDYLKQEPTVS